LRQVTPRLKAGKHTSRILRQGVTVMTLVIGVTIALSPAGLCFGFASAYYW
jgi:hypothetical protein